jgi:AraC family transcriptional regulator
MEHHLLEDVSADDVAAAIHMSSFYFQKGFRLMSGYTVGEYLRNRRLYLAALDLLSGEKVIDAALRYGYDTPESF